MAPAGSLHGLGWGGCTDSCCQCSFVFSFLAAPPQPEMTSAPAVNHIHYCSTDSISSAPNLAAPPRRESFSVRCGDRCHLDGLFLPQRTHKVVLSTPRLLASHIAWPRIVETRATLAPPPKNPASFHYDFRPLVTKWLQYWHLPWRIHLPPHPVTQLSGLLAR